MLTVRPIGADDYAVREDGQRIGRIHFAREHMPGLWLWNIHVLIPSAPFGDAATLDQAKGG